MQPPKYNAIHVRRNDFQYKDIRHLPVETIISNTKAFLEPNVPLYIGKIDESTQSSDDFKPPKKNLATDEHDPTFLDPWRRDYRSIRSLSEFMPELEDMPKHWLGIGMLTTEEHTHTRKATNELSKLK